MEERFNESTINRPEGDRFIDAPSLIIDLPEHIRQIRTENQYEKNDRNAIVVFKSGKLRIVLVALHAGAEVTTPKPENIFSLQLVEGRLFIEANNESTTITSGQMFVLHESIPYVIKAQDESVYLLTVIE
jgi:redox-sensitive bicupin YhaK (pirin superfamily)